MKDSMVVTNLCQHGKNAEHHRPGRMVLILQALANHTHKLSEEKLNTDQLLIIKKTRCNYMKKIELALQQASLGAPLRHSAMTALNKETIFRSPQKIVKK